MIYNGSNVLPKTQVCDLDTRERLRFVMEIDTDAAEITVALQPPRASADGKHILSRRIRFQAIWPIFDQGAPCAFHCHGRQP